MGGVVGLVSERGEEDVEEGDGGGEGERRPPDDVGGPDGAGMVRVDDDEALKDGGKGDGDGA